MWTATKGCSLKTFITKKHLHAIRELIKCINIHPPCFCVIWHTGKSGGTSILADLFRIVPRRYSSKISQLIILTPHKCRATEDVNTALPSRDFIMKLQLYKIDTVFNLLKAQFVIMVAKNDHFHYQSNSF